MSIDQTQTREHEFRCRMCSSSLIQPTEWISLDGHGWRVPVRCPECYEQEELILSQPAASQFALEIEEALQSLLETVEVLDREIFQSDCRIFMKAVWADHIYPMDF